MALLGRALLGPLTLKPFVEVVGLAEAGTELTFTPEFGPSGYMPALPFTKQPVADLWDVCLWMKGQYDRIKK